MSKNVPLSQRDGKADLTRGILKRAVQLGIQLLLLAAILFISSGRLDWWMAWVLLGIFVVGIVINSFILLRRNPELIAERAEVKEDIKGWDSVLSILILLSAIGTLLVAGLDVRFAWSPQIPPTLRLLALVLVVLGYAFASWALITNAFFAPTVRIQEERGHVVVSEGPYRFVRHPGYTGWILSGLALPVGLGSLWALLPAGLASIFLIKRAALEDRTLREELAGYEDYAQRVRYRLLPGVW